MGCFHFIYIQNTETPQKKTINQRCRLRSYAQMVWKKVQIFIGSKYFPDSFFASLWLCGPVTGSIKWTDSASIRVWRFSRTVRWGRICFFLFLFLLMFLFFLPFLPFPFLLVAFVLFLLLAHFLLLITWWIRPEGSKYIIKQGNNDLLNIQKCDITILKMKTETFFVY